MDVPKLSSNMPLHLQGLSVTPDYVHLNSVTIVGFVGANSEQRQVRNNGSKFTVLSVAT
jgi:hypothetical protein